MKVKLKKNPWRERSSGIEHVEATYASLMSNHRATEYAVKLKHARPLLDDPELIAQPSLLDSEAAERGIGRYELARLIEKKANEADQMILAVALARKIALEELRAADDATEVALALDRFNAKVSHTS